MSRIGKTKITIPSGTEVTVQGNLVKVKGPKGQMQKTLHSSMEIKKEGSEIEVLPRSQDSQFKKFHGLTRSLINNMVVGVSQGFSKQLKLIGVGYRAALSGKDLNLTLGFSHPVIYKVPEGIEIKVEKQTTIVVSGADKEQVGQSAANIRRFRPPEPYHGKGVRYVDETIITKVGKASGKK